MAKKNTAGIREFKAHLSRYLDEVKAGATLLITDRGAVVAELRPPDSLRRVATTEAQRYAAAVAAGLVIPAREPTDRSWAKSRGLGLPPGTAKALLDAEREE